jgi:hypothetical protein
MYPSYSLGRGMVDMQRSRIAGFFVVCVHATRSYMLYTLCCIKLIVNFFHYGLFFFNPNGFLCLVLSSM